jgi:hypothetical protein
MSDMNADGVLHAFYRDAPYLFLSAAFAAVGIVSAAFAVLRRRRDSLLIFFAFFAALYDGGGRFSFFSSRMVGKTRTTTLFAPRFHNRRVWYRARS